jgi:CRP-like cAMP-binding protein
LEVEAGEILFRRHDDGDVMYAVIEGQIDLTLEDRVVEAVGPGGILGEMALIDTAPRSATATARIKSRVARVDRKHFEFLVHEHPTFALQVMGVMADRLRHLNQRATA